jgi:hypothetical protein
MVGELLVVENVGVRTIQSNTRVHTEHVLTFHFCFCFKKNNHTQVELAGVLNVKVGNVIHRVVRNEIRG